MTLPPRARAHAGTHRRNDQMAVDPMADYYHTMPPWELSKLPVLEENFASAGALSTTVGPNTKEHRTLHDQAVDEP